MGTVNQRLREFEPEISGSRARRLRTLEFRCRQERPLMIIHIKQTGRKPSETKNRQEVSLSAASVNRRVRGVRCGRESSPRGTLFEILKRESRERTQHFIRIGEF